MLPIAEETAQAATAVWDGQISTQKSTSYNNKAKDELKIPTILNFINSLNMTVKVQPTSSILSLRRPMATFCRKYDWVLLLRKKFNYLVGCLFGRNIESINPNLWINWFLKGTGDSCEIRYFS